MSQFTLYPTLSTPVQTIKSTMSIQGVDKKVDNLTNKEALYYAFPRIMLFK